LAAAAALGYPWPAFRTIIGTEGWTRSGRGTYVAPGTEAALRTRVRVEQLRRPVLVASHRTAVALHGGDLLTAGLDFVVEGDGRYDVVGGRARRSRWVRGDACDVGGLTVTSPGLTATDVLRYLPRDEAVVAVDSLLRNGAVTLDDVALRLRCLRGERHVARAWRAFARLDPQSGSAAESLARLVMGDAALFPRSQVVLLDIARRRVRVDFWFPAGLVVEIEGYAFHSTRGQHQADVSRFNDLSRLTDQTVLRFSANDVRYRAPAMIATIRAALAARDAGERWVSTRRPA
jgi:hypothetical protein